MFCLKYEVAILSKIVNYGKLERWIPDYCNPYTHKEHMERYNWIKDFVKNAHVLDIACGTGFGSYIMATQGNAASVTACDIDADTIKYDSIKYQFPSLYYTVENAEKLTFDKTFDVITSFETIEHLTNPELLLGNARKALKDDGLFFISTPISAMAIDLKPNNPYHLIEWGFDGFQTFVGKYFEIDKVFLQLYNVAPTPKMDITSRIVRKVFNKSPNFTRIEKLTPFEWRPKDFPKSELGITWTGYQILKCKPKKN